MGRHEQSDTQNLFEIIRAKQRKQAEGDAKYLSDEKLKSLIESNDWDSDIYHAELERREVKRHNQDAQKLIETIGFREKQLQINLEAILQIISNCLCDKAYGIEWNDIPFDDKTFNISNNAEQGLIVSCSDGRKLRIIVRESKKIYYSEDGEETTYKTAIYIQYANGYRSISFDGSIEKSSWYLIEKAINADNLIRGLIPYIPTGHMLSWKKVPSYQDIMFNERELEFINSTLDKAIEGQEEARQKFLKMTPEQRNAFFS